MTLCSVRCFFCGYFIREMFFFKHGFVLLGGVAQYFFKLKSTQ